MNWVLYYDTRYCNLNLLCPRYNYVTEGVCSFTVRFIKDWNYIPRSLRVLNSYPRFKNSPLKKFLVTQFLKSFKVRNTKLKEQCQIGSVRWFVVVFFKTMYNKTIIGLGFCDIPNNQDHSKCYQPRPSARLITLPSNLIIPNISQTSSNNCLLKK